MNLVWGHHGCRGFRVSLFEINTTDAWHTKEAPSSPSSTHTHENSPYLTITDTANNALSPNGGTTPTINQLVKFTIEYMLCAQNLMLKYIFIL
jgi:hypothetical protein